MFKKMLVFREVTTSPTSGMDLSEIWEAENHELPPPQPVAHFFCSFQESRVFPLDSVPNYFEDLKKNHPCDTTNSFKLTHNLPNWVDGSQLRDASFTLKTAPGIPKYLL